MMLAVSSTEDVCKELFLEKRWIGCGLVFPEIFLTIFQILFIGVFDLSLETYSLHEDFL